MTSPSRRIDHLVLAVRDLDAAAAWYERLGFQVGARNRHPWGTENRLVQFGSSFLELITVGDPAGISPHAPGVFSFGAFVRDYLADREGLAMLVLDSADAATDAALFARQAIGDFQPFFFERSGERPNGTATHVAFTLAFARNDALPDAAFFVCQQHFPEAFWNPALQCHDNGATEITEVTLAVDEPAKNRHFLEGFTGRPMAAGDRFSFDNGGELRLEVQPGLGRFVGFTVGVPDLDTVAELLQEGGIHFVRTAARISIAADVGLGVRVEFEGDAHPWAG